MIGSATGGQKIGEDRLVTVPKAKAEMLCARHGFELVKRED
jgi:hypothetical protein